MLGIQAIAVVAIAIWTIITTSFLLWMISKLVPLRTSLLNGNDSLLVIMTFFLKTFPLKPSLLSPTTPWKGSLRLPTHSNHQLSS